MFGVHYFERERGSARVRALSPSLPLSLSQGHQEAIKRIYTKHTLLAIERLHPTPQIAQKAFLTIIEFVVYYFGVQETEHSSGTPSAYRSRMFSLHTIR